MRYALYFTPAQDDPLTLAAQAWLGRDAFTGARIVQPTVAGMTSAELARLTSDPRRYGFHGTLVAPFRLRDGLSPQAVRRAADSFVQGCAPFAIPSLAMVKIGSFIALAPSEAGAVSALASAAVDHFNGLRAPLSPSETERRRPERLSERQRAYLDRYGYPYVKEEFRFHMTLTGPLEAEEAVRIEPALRDHFGPLLARPVEVSTVSLFVEAEPGSDFIVESTHRFGAAAARKYA